MYAKGILRKISIATDHMVLGSEKFHSLFLEGSFWINGLEINAVFFFLRS